jgi:ribonuclease HI
MSSTDEWISRLCFQGASAHENDFHNTKQKFSTQQEAEEFVANYKKPVMPPMSELKRKLSDLSDDISPSADMVVVYTDGNCKANGRTDAIAGSAIHFPNKQHADIFRRPPGKQTNSRAELYACALALLATIDDIDVWIRPDSEYVSKGIVDDTWLAKWSKNRWLKGENELVVNSDLWNVISLLLEERTRRVE